MTIETQIANISRRDLAIAAELGRSAEDYWFATRIARDLIFAASYLRWMPAGSFAAYRFRDALIGYGIPSMPRSEFFSHSVPPAGIPVISDDRTGRPLLVNLPALLAVAPQFLRGGLGPRKPLPVG